MSQELQSLRPDESIPAWAFRFLQAIPGVTMVLSGMSTLDQIKDNVAIWQEDKPLSPQEFEKIVTLADAETKKGGLPCTACHYCVSHCPKHLPLYRKPYQDTA